MKIPIFLLLIILISCSTDPENFEVNTDYENFLMTQDYDSIYVKSENIFVKKKNIDKIEIGFLKDDNYFLIDSLIPNFVDFGQAFQMEFEFHIKINKSYSEYQFLISYYFKNGQSVDIESLIQLEYYPYSFLTKKLYLKLDDVFQGDIFPQDLDFDKNNLYLHPTASWGVFQISLSTNTATELVNYPAGDFIAVDSSFIFYETGAINRYNQITDSTDLIIIWDYKKYNNIAGIDAYKGNLYILLSNDDQIDLVQYDYDGNYIQTIPYNKNIWFLSVYLNIAHSRERIDDKFYISRFDLNTKTFLESIPYPVLDPEGFKIFNNKFYYTEWDTREIYSINMYEIATWN